MIGHAEPKNDALQITPTTTKREQTRSRPVVEVVIEKVVEIGEAEISRDLRSDVLPVDECGVEPTTDSARFDKRHTLVPM